MVMYPSSIKNRLGAEVAKEISVGLKEDTSQGKISSSNSMLRLLFVLIARKEGERQSCDILGKYLTETIILKRFYCNELCSCALVLLSMPIVKVQLLNRLFSSLFENNSKLSRDKQRTAKVQILYLQMGIISSFSYCGSGHFVVPIKAGFVARFGRRNTGT
ncbi:hypothetical protein WN944_004412 [Citrus x changshan-huyou]|uniref:Uncharacterized protein n=1 Tax=Citrus x changshan-huyou TaxID=2935761 RepID=A0AAP0M3X0_9ROSI